MRFGSHHDQRAARFQDFAEEQHVFGTLFVWRWLRTIAAFGHGLAQRRTAARAKPAGETPAPLTQA